MKGRILAIAVLMVSSGCGATTLDAERFLDEGWALYQDAYLQAPGYVLDPRRDGGAVTSEGQGYALLRSVWERDEASFARIFEWTEENLRRPDGLYSWLWSPGGGGRIVDANTATDADQEIAYALAMACSVFGRPEYGVRARDLVRAIREGTGIEVAGHWFPSAGNWARDGRVLNLSYFVPYAYEWFDRLDPEGGWSGVADVGYDLIGRSLGSEDRRLVPDFQSVDASGDPRRLSPDIELSQEFSFDAVRLFWRVEADCALTGRSRACEDPLRVNEVTSWLDVEGRVVSSYATDGTPRTDESSMSFPGALLVAAKRHAPQFAREVLAPQLADDHLVQLARASDRYYDQNWVWFGFALDAGLIQSRTPLPVSCVVDASNPRTGSLD